MSTGYIVPPRTQDGNELRKKFVEICQRLNELLFGPRSKLISTTHDVSVTGDQAITGVGFQPSGGVIMATVDATLAASWGMFDSSTTLGVLNANRGGTEDTYQVHNIIYLYLSGGTSGFSIKSLDSDGLTITWAKISSPTGTATIKFLLFR